MASAELGCSSTGAGVFSGTPLCTLVIPNSLLLLLHTHDCIDHINKNIKGKVVTLDVSCTRLEKTLQKLVGKVQYGGPLVQFSRFAPRPISSSSFRLFSPASSLSPPAFLP